MQLCDVVECGRAMTNLFILRRMSDYMSVGIQILADSQGLQDD